MAFEPSLLPEPVTQAQVDRGSSGCYKSSRSPQTDAGYLASASTLSCVPVAPLLRPSRKPSCIQPWRHSSSEATENVSSLFLGIHLLSPTSNFERSLEARFWIHLS